MASLDDDCRIISHEEFSVVRLDQRYRFTDETFILARVGDGEIRDEICGHIRLSGGISNSLTRLYCGLLEDHVLRASSIEASAKLAAAP